MKPGKVFVPMATQTSQVDAIPPPPMKVKASATKPKKSVAPRFVTTLQGRTAEEGERLVLEAVVDGVPECKITWMHNAVAVKPGPDVRIGFEQKRTSLTIAKVRQQICTPYTYDKWDPVIFARPLDPSVSQWHLHLRRRKHGRHVAISG